MKWFFKSLFLIVAIYISTGLLVSNYLEKIYSSNLNHPHPSPYYDYSGALNVHTTLSTGTGSFEEVVRSAQKAQLDFLFITDLNQFPVDLKKEAYYNNLLVLMGGEYRYLNSSFLNIGFLSQKHLKFSEQSQALFKGLLSKEDSFKEEGLFILAHPFEKNFQWKGEYPKGLDGIEIINLSYSWKNAWENQKLSFFWTLLLYPFHSRFSFARLFKYPEKHLKLWDKLAEQRPTIGLAGSDAESRFNFITDPLKFPSYETLFSVVKNHVFLRSELTGDKEKDIPKILSAFKNGNIYFSIDFIRNPKGFLAFVRNNKKEFLPGSEVKLVDETKLFIKLPPQLGDRLKAVVYRNGKEEAVIFKSNKIFYNLELKKAGNYRIIIWMRLKYPPPDRSQWVPWIFTNHFYIRK